MELLKEYIKKIVKEIITEKWSQKYKDSINCNNPKGFSQRAHCQGKKKKSLNETYKLSFQDKQDIEKNIRGEYDKYLKDINEKNKEIKKYRQIIDNAKEKLGEDDYNALLKNFGLIANQELESPMRYNEFYLQNKENITKNYIDDKNKNSLSDFKYPLKKIDTDIEQYYENLSKEELKSIKDFLNIVSIRILSGTGESISRTKVRDMFFKTPNSFQKMFSEKPNPYLWRGDYSHPSNKDYDKEDKNYLSMQSFTINKNVAKEFGSHFSASNIKSYGGSFSIPKFIEYGYSDLLGDLNLADDEGEVMFFDVTYK